MAEPQRMEIELRVNREARRLDVDTRSSLLDVLREELGLTGAKKGCDHGQCGACTILIDGRRANSCLALAVAHDGAELTTVEGLADGERLHTVQAAFVEHDGFQCGYCTPGQICSAVGMLSEAAEGWPSAVTADLSGAVPPLDADEISERTGEYTQTLDDAGVLGSIGSAGDALDNALAESFVDSVKTELIADRVWRTRSQLELAIVEYVRWCNTARLHESLGDLPPAEFEALHAPRLEPSTPTHTI